MQSSESANRERFPQNPATLRNPRRTLAFFGCSVSVDIAQKLWPGLRDAARTCDVNLLHITGDSLGHPVKFRHQANVLYDLVNPARVDGLISWTSVLGSFGPPEDLTAFLARYSGVPMVSVGKIVEGMPSVVMDSYQGMYAAVEHLITVHGARRLACIRGPEEHFYAQERYQAYRDALRAHDIPYDDGLITPPYKWDISYGARAIHLLLDERGLQPGTTLDAVVSVNDKMALGAIQALQARDLRVPHDLAVTGFNDDPGSRFTTPSLTSVKAPLYDVGVQAIDLLLTRLSGASGPDRVNVPAILIVRQSCGCLPPVVAKADAGPGAVRMRHTHAPLSTRRQDLLPPLIAALGECEQASAWAAHVLEAFIHEIDERASGTFLAALNDVVRQTIAAGETITPWHAALSALRRHVLPVLDTEDALSRAENVWQQARAEIGEAEKRLQGAQELQRWKQIWILRNLSADLLTTFDVAGLMDILWAGLPRLGIPSCYLALYDDPRAPANGARLMLAYDKQGRLDIESDGHHAPAFGSVPEDMVFEGRRSTFIVEALYFQEDQIGFVLFEAEAPDGIVYEILRGEISSALQGALLVQRVQEHAAEITRKNYILDTFMANVPDSIYFKDRESRIIQSNQAHAASFGLTDPGDLIGKSDFDLFPEKQARPKYEQEQGIIWTGEPVLALEEQSAGGHWALTTKMPLRDEHGEIIGTFGISRDITELKTAQRALQEAYSEISMLNAHLQEENVRMSAELSVVKQLQQMILPRPQELAGIPGLDIVGFMRPADEVGGDYYDVLRANEVIHIGIGDVTGHGLESGVLMLMTQAAIRTLIEHGETDPIKFVNTLNRLIYKNVQRIGTDKNLTFALVQYRQGQIKLVGQHEEVLVVRRGGRVERVDTMELGFPVGLEPEITDWVHAATIRLQPGDGIVLYTDGITEAANLADDLYGIERLCEIVGQHWEASAEAIKQAVIDDVTWHIGDQKVYDDLSLVVLKHILNAR